MSHSGGGESSVERGRRSEGEGRCYFIDLVDDLLVEILIRLPIETVVRCKAVCKKWCALIGEGDDFTRRYIHRRHTLHLSRKPLSLVYQLNYPRYRNPSQGTNTESVTQVSIATESLLVHKFYKDGVVDMRFLPCVQQLFPSILPNRPLEFTLEASCADLLVCCYNNPSTSMSVYYICNVTTKQWVALPPIETCSADVGLLCDQMPCLDCELEFNARYNYKLVRIPLPRHVQTRSEFKIQIFCSKEGRWINSVVSLSCLVQEPLVKNHMIAYNRMLHMLALNTIIVFDPFCENPVSRIIDLPPGESIRPQNNCYIFGSCFGVSGGRLCLSKISRNEVANPILQVWELVDYDNVKWCLALRISNIRLLFPGLELTNHFSIAILAFHPYKRDILFLRVGEYIVKCNMRQQNKFTVLREFICPNHYRMESSWLSTFQLVHHWWPTPVPPVPEIRDADMSSVS